MARAMPAGITPKFTTADPPPRQVGRAATPTMHPIDQTSITTARSRSSRPSSRLSQHSTATAPTAASKRRAAIYTPPPPPTPPPTTRLLFNAGPRQSPTAAAVSAAARPPLRTKDRNQNVPALTATRTKVTSSASRMPVGERPRQPQLSAAAAKAVNRTPLTPKIAPKGLPVVTPLGRRTQNPSVAASQTYTKEDGAATTPVAGSGGPFLNNNITPRSGHRQSRVDSTNTTPSGTPNPERNSDGFEAGRISGAASMAYDGARQASPPEIQSDSSDSKFFYASDARNPQQAQQRPPPTLPHKPTTFFYANAASVNDGKRRLSPPTHTPFTALSPTTEPSASKFFYANGTPDLAPKAAFATSGSNSTISSTSRAPAKRPSTSHSGIGVPTSLPQRPLSPIKVSATPMAQPMRNSAVPPSQQNRSQVSSPQPTLAPVTAARSRGVTIETGPKPARGHVRGGSVPMIDPLPGPRLTFPTSASPEPTSPPLSPGLSQPAMTMASILQAVEDLADNDESASGDAQTEPQSPTKSIHSSDAISELVANARRERKVQDLEITNASLEAINRTLERQLRKQTAELRRYRRLSRSGHISLASMPSSRVTSAAMTEPPEDLSDLEEEEESYMSEEEPDSLDDSDLSDEDSVSAVDPLSPSAKLVARRKRDEKRLQLDLSKHQELLIDSQKMNQSLKRCLDWTEVLIKEGQKALEYRVRVSDVELGGHVLAPPDEEEEDVSFVADKTHAEDASARLDRDSEPAETSLEPPWTKGPQDRDSGIELPTDSG